MAIWGPQRLFTVGRRVSLRRGQYVRLLVGPALPGRDDVALHDQTRTLGRALAGLLERVQREHPDQPVPGVSAWWHPAHLGGAAPSPEVARALEGPMPPGAVAPLFGAY